MKNEATTTSTTVMMKEGRKARERKGGREWQPIRDGMGVETGPPGAGATITQSALPRWSPFSLSPTGDDGFVVFVVPLVHCASTGPCHHAVVSLSLYVRRFPVILVLQRTA